MNQHNLLIIEMFPINYEKLAIIWFHELKPVQLQISIFW